MIENLLDPFFLFFLVGYIGGMLKSDLKLPDAVYHLLSTYPLLAIGLKGGEGRTGSDFVACDSMREPLVRCWLQRFCQTEK